MSVQQPQHLRYYNSLTQTWTMPLAKNLWQKLLTTKHGSGQRHKLTQDSLGIDTAALRCVHAPIIVCALWKDVLQIVYAVLVNQFHMETWHADDKSLVYLQVQSCIKYVHNGQKQTMVPMCILSRWQTNDKICRFYRPIFSAKLEPSSAAKFIADNSGR